MPKEKTIRLIEILEELRDSIKQQNLNISDDVLFSEACGFLRGEFAGEQRFNPRPFPSGGSMPCSEKKEVKKASDKQLAFIQRLADKKGKKLEVNANMTSFEANKLIEELSK